MKTKIASIALAALAPLVAHAFDFSTPAGFEEARRPVTNAVFFDLAVPRTGVHAIFIHHEFPDQVATTGDPVAFGGDLQVYALQAELALNENFSIVAAKDGYIDFSPDNTLSGQTGFADLALGIKHTFLRDDDQQLALAYKVIVELPTGDDDVWQGNGKGNVVPAFTFLKLWDALQFAGNIGVVIPFDDDEESMIFMQSYHLSYAVTENIFPLVELNHYHVLDAANGTSHFNTQAGGAVPGIVPFEGGDLVNLGSSNSDGTDIVTIAVGARVRVTDKVDIGGALEVPLTDDEESLYDKRFTLDVDWRF